MAAFHEFITLTLTGGEEPITVRTTLVSWDYFEILGAHPLLGRTFLPEEERVPEGHAVTVLSYGLWQNLFGGDSDIVGRAIQLSGLSYTVVGVMPRDFYDVSSNDHDTGLWIPVMMFPRYLQPTGGGSVLERRNTRFIGVVARLVPGVDRRAARAEMDSLASQLREEYPKTNRDRAVQVVTMKEIYYQNVFQDVTSAVWTLAAGAAFLLLIVCANVANLYSVRALARRQEVAARLALGASRSRVLRQFFVEGLLLSVLGGGLGVLLSLFGLEPLLSLNPVRLPGYVEVRVDGDVLLLSLALSTLASVVFSLLPALQAFPGSRSGLRAGLEPSWRNAGSSARATALRHALIIGEVAVTVVLLVGAMLVARSLARLQGGDLGFQTDSRLTLRMDLQSTRYTDPSARARFGRRLVEEAGAIPGVVSAGLWSPNPPGETTLFTMVVPEGHAGPVEEARVVVRFKTVSSGRARMRWGRGFGVPLRWTSGIAWWVSPPMPRTRAD